MMAQLWPSCHVKWIRRPSNLGLMLKTRTRRFLDRLKLSVLINSESCSCSQFVLYSYPWEVWLMKMLWCAENPAGCAADLKAEPGHVIRDGGGRSIDKGQHIIWWLLRWVLISSEWSIIVKHKLPIAMVAGSNLLDMLRRTAKWSETLNVHYHVPAHSLYWL